MPKTHDPLCDQTHRPRQRCNHALAAPFDPVDAFRAADASDHAADGLTVAVSLASEAAQDQGAADGETIGVSLPPERAADGQVFVAEALREREAAREGAPSPSPYAGEAWARAAEAVGPAADDKCSGGGHTGRSSAEVWMKRAALAAAGIGALAVLALMLRDSPDATDIIGGLESLTRDDDEEADDSA